MIGMLLEPPVISNFVVKTDEDIDALLEKISNSVLEVFFKNKERVLKLILFTTHKAVVGAELEADGEIFFGESALQKYSEIATLPIVIDVYQMPKEKILEVITKNPELRVNVVLLKPLLISGVFIPYETFESSDFVSTAIRLLKEAGINAIVSINAPVQFKGHTNKLAVDVGKELRDVGIALERIDIIMSKASTFLSKNRYVITIKAAVRGDKKEARKVIARLAYDLSEEITRTTDYTVDVKSIIVEEVP